jgi:4a-hydroxytetrahydrobiopterin dehydratase
MATLGEQKCVPCEGGVPPATAAEIQAMQQQVPDWHIIRIDGDPRLNRVFCFSNFKQALAFTQKVGDVAEQAGHHPALLTEWGKVTVTWWTHAINGLHQNDFIMAAKTDAVAQQFN